MRNKHRWLQNITFVLFLCSFQGLAIAGDFANAFKDFILGSDVQASTRDALLVNSTRSERCMQCHDGSSAKAIVLKDADAPLHISGYRNVNHPVGLNYSQYASNSPVSYVRPENLDARIQLENGDVTCVSCHESRETNEFQAQSFAFADEQEQVCDATGSLTVGPRKTDLCMSCHSM